MEIVKRFGKVGGYYFNISRGIDNRKVTPNRPHKSVSVENTYNYDLTDESEMLEKLDILCQELALRLKKSNIFGRTVTVKIKFNDFKQTTRSRTVDHYIGKPDEIFFLVKELLHSPEFPPKPVRLFGVGLNNLNTDQKKGDGIQLTLDF